MGATGVMGVMGVTEVDGNINRVSYERSQGFGWTGDFFMIQV